MIRRGVSVFLILLTVVRVIRVIVVVVIVMVSMRIVVQIFAQDGSLSEDAAHDHSHDDGDAVPEDHAQPHHPPVESVRQGRRRRNDGVDDGAAEEIGNRRGGRKPLSREASHHRHDRTLADGEDDAHPAAMATVIHPRFGRSAAMRSRVTKTSISPPTSAPKSMNGTASSMMLAKMSESVRTGVLPGLTTRTP
jgi:hypothetical protein